MIQITKQTNVDRTIFISNDEPHYKVAAIFFAMAQKRYYCSNDIIEQYMMLDNEKVAGIYPRFERFDLATNSGRRNFEIHRDITRGSNIVKLHVKYDSRSKSTKPAELSYRVFSKLEEPHKILEQLGKGNFKGVDNVCVKASMLLDSAHFEDKVELSFSHKEDIEKEKRHLEENSLDDCVSKARFFEDNFESLIPLCMLPQISNFQQINPVELNLRSVNKLGKFIHVFKTLTIPSREARKKFIELCSIFRQNKVIDKIQISNFSFTKIGPELEIRLIGVPIVREESLEKFVYLDHPGVNLAVQIVERLNLFDNIESKICREILVHI